LYDFLAGDLEITPRAKVVVETERGTGVATVVAGPTEVSQEEAAPNLVMIKRLATEEDLDILKQNLVKEKEAYDFCNRRIMERGMQMKLVRVEYLFDGSKAIFFFTADGRVDFRDLVKDLAHTFHTRIEMRQIGVRDESKMVGGIGICGRELCCCSWLREFQPVSVKMAKEQNLALNPNKISGQCGRLLCCLDYEYETYCGLRKTFPKCGKRVRTDSVTGVVDKMNILTGNITLKLDDGKLIVVKKAEILGEVAGPEPAAARLETATAASARPPQKTRDRKPERPPKPERTPSAAPPPKAESKPAAPEAAPDGAAAQQPAGQPRPPRKKQRSHRPGQRKPGAGGTPEGGSDGTPKT
jgi:cell fate regulator YaaT (PSP1 superfamily)